MAGKFAASWVLTKQSWSVLRVQKGLVLFPLISGMLTILIVCTFMIPSVIYIAMSVGGYLGQPANGGSSTGGSAAERLEPWQQAVLWVAIFVCYFLANIVITFFNSALVACAMQHFAGEATSPMRGLQAALGRWKQILAWAFVNATVGVVLQFLKDKAGWLARMVLGAAGVAWTIATFFVVPVLVIEGVGPIEALKRSTSVLKKTWGESLIVQFGVGTVMGLIGLLAFVLCTGAGIGLAFAVQSPIPGFIGAGIGVVLVILIMLVASTLKTILVAACYRYASTGRVPDEFDSLALRNIVGPKH